jgi:hypothetical protein
MKNKILYLGLALAASSLLNPLFAEENSILAQIKAAAAETGAGVENYFRNPSEREKALRNPDVEAVTISQHFKRADKIHENQTQNGLIEGLLLKGVVGGATAFATVKLTKPKEGNKVIARLVRKGFNVTAKGLGIYLVTDGVSSFVLTLMEYDPSPTAIPGVVGFLGRQTEETVKEVPARATATAHSVTEWAKALPSKISKQFKGEVQE